MILACSGSSTEGLPPQEAGPALTPLTGQIWAHFGMHGSIDFLALPHFDSPTVFAALLDAEKSGRFQIAPWLGDARQKQLYLPDANILLTRFLTDEGVAELSDFMPVEEVEQAHKLVRRVKTVRGEICFRTFRAPRFDYARVLHRVERRENEVMNPTLSGRLRVENRCFAWFANSIPCQ